MSANQLSLFQQYNKQLQALNDAKSQQIQTLTKNLKNCQEELDQLRMLQIIKNKQKESPILRRQKIVESCRNCGSKDEMIKNKDRQIKTLEQSIRLLEARYKDLMSKVQSIEQNKIKPQSQPQTQLNHLNTSFRQPDNHLIINQYPMPHHQQSLKQQNRVLGQRIQYLQKRVFTLEDSNRILRQQILQYIHSRKTGTLLNSKNNMHHHQSCTFVTIRPQKYLASNSYENGNNSFCIKHRLLREDWKKDNNQNYDQGCNYSLRHLLSPLKKQNQPRKYLNYDNKNLLQQHNETLQRKIQILKKQNQRLKEQISFTTS